MIKFQQSLHSPSILTLALLCTAGNLSARDNVSAPDAPAVRINGKQAAGLARAHPAPEYPSVAKVNYLQGPVVLELRVNSSGRVANAHVLHGNAVLAVAAMKAALRWAYRPLPTAAGPSGFVTTVKIKFTLNCQGIGLELTPRQAERDFLRQVKPPQVMRHPVDADGQDTVHMRLLINDQGQVVDEETSPAGDGQFSAVRESLRSWTFRPAHWGSLSIPAYLNVDVPVRASSLAEAAPNAGSR